MMTKIPVFYTSKMIADSESFSPSAAKPKPVVESWLQLGIPISVIEPEPATVEQLIRVHDSYYVQDVMSCMCDNGFGNRLPDVARSLIYTNGSMLSAAREAVANNTVAVAPCSGFHHAGYYNGEGFCTFNGLMMAAKALRSEDLVNRVGILDFDMHYGNGTDNIIMNIGAKNWIRHYTAGAYFSSPQQADVFLADIPNILGGMYDCDVILYQAGADPHIDDPFGGWLTNDQLAERDRIVFETCRDLRLPVAWNLAGGYQTPLRNVLDIHDNTMRACWDVYGQHD